MGIDLNFGWLNTQFLVKHPLFMVPQGGRFVVPVASTQRRRRLEDFQHHAQRRAQQGGERQQGQSCMKKMPWLIG
jgi:hypothetical protein